MQGFWIYVGPIIHAIFTIVDFILIPLTIIIQICLAFKTIGSSIYTAALILYPIISLFTMLWVPLQILPIFLGAIAFTKRLQM